MSDLNACQTAPLVNIVSAPRCHSLLYLFDLTSIILLRWSVR